MVYSSEAGGFCLLYANDFPRMILLDFTEYLFFSSIIGVLDEMCRVKSTSEYADAATTAHR